MLRAWLLLALAIAVHVADEAVTGFLPVYNNTVRSIREAAPWVHVPTFTFPLWIAGLTAGVVLMLLVAPAVQAGRGWTRIVAALLALLMVANAVGHTTASVYFERPMPGFWSSPFLLAASFWLLNQVRTSKRFR